jgi:hypothetical protein
VRFLQRAVLCEVAEDGADGVGFFDAGHDPHRGFEMHEDVDRADRVLVMLSQLLRRALDASMAGEVALGEEIAFREAHLEIEMARFDQRYSGAAGGR